MKVLVSGCACSGTVLLTRLMFSFKEVRESVLPSPHYKMQILTDGLVKSRGNHCCKGSRKQVLSGNLRREELDRQYELLKEAKVLVPFVVRYPPDVMSSARTNGIFHHLKNLWLEIAKQWERYSDIISTTVRFEDVVSQPDETQERIAQDMGFTICHPFSQYPRFMKPEWMEDQKKEHSARPLDASRINKPRRYGLKKGKAWITCYPPSERKQVERYLDMFGYEVN